MNDLVEYVSNFPMTSAEVVVHRKDCPRVKRSKYVRGILGARSLVAAVEVEAARTRFAGVRACEVCERSECRPK